MEESCGVLGSRIELSSDFLMMAALINSLSVFLTGGSDSNHVSGPFCSVVDPKLFFFFGSGSGSYLDLNFGSGFGFGSGVFMKNTFEIHMI